NGLHFFAHLGSRILARVLPTSDILKKCEDLGLAANQIIAVQGPFSADFNLAVYRDHQIDILVTKDSGPEGGVGEKVYPALAAGLQVLMIRRPVPEKNS
ncbi:MAG: precorrin-6A/cobalt-precorrin-6A reductase, partial [Clostridiales bacterium]